MRYFYILMLTLLCVSCEGFKNSNSSNQSENNSEPIAVNQQSNSTVEANDNYDLWNNNDYTPESSNSTEQPFYIYHNDNGEVWISYSQEEEDEYQMMKAREAHYKEMARQNDFHNWESEDIRAFYVLLDGVSDSDQADYYAREYYDGEYIEEWGNYYAKTSDVRSGEYEVELGERVNNKFFKIRGTDLYVLFKWSTSLSRGDEGVLDVWSAKGTFYINPNNKYYKSQPN